MRTARMWVVGSIAGWFVLAGSVGRGGTTFLGGNLNSAGNWDNGLPGTSNPGAIAVDGTNGSTVFNFGAGSVVDQTAGIITSGDGFNLTNGTWDLSGGAIRPRYFLSNGASTLINVSGGSVQLKNVSGTQHMGAANGGTLTVSGSAVLDGTEATLPVQTGGAINFEPNWTGSWTWGTYSGNDWRSLLTTSNAILLDWTSIDGPTFDSTFSVTPDGKTLSMPGGTPRPPGAPIAQFDFNDGGDLNDDQPGYASLDADQSIDSVTHNGITLAVSGMGNFGRDRGLGGNVAASPVPDVTRDLIFTDDGRGLATPYLTAELSGLLPDTEYDFRWHHYEQGSGDDRNRLALYQDSAVLANLLFETGPYDRDTTNYFTDFSAITSSLGELTLVTGPHSGGRSIQMLNGFEVLAAHLGPGATIPEPSTAALLALAMGCLAARMQRRRGE